MTDDPDELALVVQAPTDAGERADVILGRHLPGVSRRMARTLGLEGHLYLDDRRCPPSTRVPLGGRLTLRVRGPGPAPAPRVLARSERFVYVDKPAGMHTHRLRPDDAPTLADAVERLHPECREASPEPREGGAVHRLDRETTGVVAFARTREAWEQARAGFHARHVQKVYRARVRPGIEPWPPRRVATFPAAGPAPAGPWPAPVLAGVTIDAPLGPAGRERVTVRDGGRPAITLAWPLPTAAPEPTELLLRLVTGHRHQARVHLAWIACPIVGDAAYGGPPARFLRLHATALDLSAACPGEPRVYAALPAGWDET
jgi:23S rRNA pseudouridine1911/1915/1917 synthase